ncbi:arabinan endo-1,5-alpha-L-arabinosidase [Gracilibacillus ureilyticus]|uniref:Arabinan endo-1,5-alpha-L-arabinosidase n=1 Tax=Gracilibacillus ureilyticus TaxID=531814 RepID=A0A1H9MXF5_9BACI|nr:arabinan endo-1,5-alpha-L-arabinosidase [Gracilibacillus ureilyticus]SER28396.1 arabinan endo-1,5-alpha-L-arabinosidase [Gracilibacillus ureilyticus]
MINQTNIPEDVLYNESIIGDEEKWTTNNVHDPAIIKDGEWYYVFSTDAQHGGVFKAGIQIRKSKDLINWQWVGRAFAEGVPETAKQWTGAKGLWAPEIVKYEGVYYMYYAASQFGKTQSFIGVAKSDHIEGPYQDLGEVYKSEEGTDGPNAIDPNITFDRDGKPWMVYGSFFGGLYVAEVDPETGKFVKQGRGTLIAKRNHSVDRALEGPYIVYNPTFDYFYLFVSYDSLFSNYNIRIARSKNIEGPYEDFRGNVMTDLESPQYEIGTKVLGGYRFMDGEGWVAPGHNSILTDNGDYYVCHHVRAPKDKRWHYLHIRKIGWTSDGWPLVSPERYAGEENHLIEENRLYGEWEWIHVDQLNDGQDVAKMVQLDKDTWQQQSAGNCYTILLNGTKYDGVVMESWDWEKWKKTIVYMGKDQQGNVVISKKA